VKKIAATLSSLLVALLAVVPAHADEEDGHSVSLTIAPILLILPLAEVQVEIKVDNDVSVSAILGVGEVSVVVVTSSGESISTSEETFSIFEAGVQGVYYAVSDFEEGMQLGAELLYVRVGAGDSSYEDISAFADGLAIGPFIGYKGISSFGLTFQAQLGASYLIVRGEAENSDTGETATETDSTISPRLRINLGWSF
jgi:hypothetical protein